MLRNQRTLQPPCTPISDNQKRLRDAKTALRELKKENALSSSDEEREENEESARSLVEFWQEQCDETMASLKLLTANMAANVLPGQPAKASAIKSERLVVEVDGSNSSHSLEANSSDSSSYDYMGNGKENLGKKCRKRPRKEKLAFLSSEGSSDEGK
jgi:hypothetical protein